MKKKNIILTVLAFALVLASAAENVWAYFTTYTEAAGGFEINLSSRTWIDEEVDGLKKTISIHNSDDSRPVYVRVGVFYGGAYDLVVNKDESSAKWVKKSSDDVYYYYTDIVEPGKATENLVVEIKDIPAAEDAKEIDSINIVVVYESTPVQYDADGKPYEPLNEKVNWAVPLETEEEARTGKGAKASE